MATLLVQGYGKGLKNIYLTKEYPKIYCFIYLGSSRDHRLLYEDHDPMQGQGRWTLSTRQLQSSYKQYNVSTGCPKKMRLLFCLISRQPNIGFSNHFLLLKIEIHSYIFNTKPFLCDIRGPEIFTKQNAVLKLIESYSCCLIVASKPHHLHQAPPIGPRWALIAPNWLLVGPVTQTD